MRLLPSADVARGVRIIGKGLARPWTETLQEVYHRLAPHRVAHNDGLVSMCVELCRYFGIMHFERDKEEMRIVGMSPLRWTSDYR